MNEPQSPDRVFFFGHKALVVYLAFLNAFVPLSIDLYLPALPDMTGIFAVSRQTINLTLSMFMLCFAMSMLFWGPFSDRYGRKKVLSIGLIVYVAASFFCAEASSIQQLILGRVLQAAGCGAVQSVSMAIVKDTFRGRTMENVLVWIQTMTILCPMLAPMFGAFLLHYVSWRGLFWLLLAGGVAGLLVSIALKETLTERSLASSPLRSLGRILVVLQDKGLRSLLFLFSFMAMPIMGYISISAFIYMTFFQTSSEAFSYFFAANACASLLGPVLYMRILRELPRVFFVSLCFSAMACGGLLLLFFGHSSPFFFALLFAPVTFFGSAMRPVGAVLIMSQLDTDNGTVASLMGSSTLFFGSMSMLFCSLNWDNPVTPLGIICLAVGLFCLFLWRRANVLKIYRTPE